MSKMLICSLRSDGPIDENNRPWTTPAGPVAHKLGPKANQGAINACLRALDRRGPPCRKWSRKPFAVKSFTGVMWELPTWGAPKRQKKDDDDKDKDGSTPAANSDKTPAKSSSNVGSDAPAEQAMAANSPAAVATPA